MQQWAEDNNNSWNSYFKKVSGSRAMFDIKDGKVSPWLVLNSPSGKDLLSRLDDVQLNSISVVIDPQVWVKRFKSDKADLELVRHIIKQGEL
jgi:hypothetical protein